jgi:hypothetical protein
MACGIDTAIAQRRIDMATCSITSGTLMDKLARMQMQNTEQYSSHFDPRIAYAPGAYVPATPIRYDANGYILANPKTRRKTMLDNVKGYVEKHKDMLFTLGLVILVDHFLFKGALRERIKATVEGALKKVENSFHKEA